MKGLIDRLFLLIIGGALVFFSGISTVSMVISILIMTVCFSLGVFFEDRKGRLVIFILAGISLILVEGAVPIFLLIVYESATGFFKKKYINIIALSIVVILYVLAALFKGTSDLVSMVKLQPMVGVVLAISVGLSVYLAYSTVKMNNLWKEKLRLRDDNEEIIRLERTRQLLLARNQEAEIDMATLKERNRIAREIHDNVGHLLSRCILQIGAICMIHKNEPVAKELEAVKLGLDESMNNIRSSVHNLHNEALDLEKSIKKLIGANKNYDTNFEYDVENDIPMKIKYCIISIITEGFQNATKHSNGNQVEIIVREHPGIYQLVFSDNGSNAKLKESGIGLHNMEERVRELSGTISFSVETGFRIFVSIPKENM